MSFNSSQLDELVQQTLALQNRPREERRMQTVEFTALVNDHELAVLNSDMRVEIINARWRQLNHQMATYIAENLSANQYQLLRAVRSEGRNPIYGHRTVTLTLTLEVGQVTEMPFIYSSEQMVATVRAAMNGAFNDQSHQQERERLSDEWELGNVLRRQQFQDAARRLREQLPRKPDPVPQKRHILIDKKDKQ